MKLLMITLLYHLHRIMHMLLLLAIVWMLAHLIMIHVMELAGALIGMIKRLLLNLILLRIAGIVAVLLITVQRTLMRNHHWSWHH